MSVGARLGKVLIANRGEIACRVIRSARRLGVKTVAVYSDADIEALHVAMADEAFNIGKAPAQESYLRGTKIIEVAKSCGARAIHPGYGFLSENAEFADLCGREGVVFIGPPPQAIRDMGIKSTSKTIMSATGVPVIPGYHGSDQSFETLKQEADKIGYPLMIKAVRGGGGKGMRIVNAASEFISSLESARRESLRSFGDDAVLLERYVGRPRHIEVQVFADSLGNCVHLFERDCSVQRRHQKVIEQAPAPGIDDSLRSKLGDAAVRAAKAVGYIGAGTVEFIMDTETNKFYFMEMNTRLQVEHPVTEMVTGVDLVEWQLGVASGQPLPMTQDQLLLNGHSIEARIYAEDVPGGFVPTAGLLKRLRTPPIDESVRVEIGVTEGDAVSVHYDPMIAKLIVWAPTPDSAFHKLERALSEFNIVGIENNVDFLRALCRNRDLVEGNVHTGFIDEHKDTLLNRTPAKIIIAQAALSRLLVEQAEMVKSAANSSDPFSPFAFEYGFRLNHTLTREIKLKYNNKNFTVEVTLEKDNTYMVRIDGGDSFRVVCSLVNQGDGDDGFLQLRTTTGTQTTITKLARDDDGVYIFDRVGDFKLKLVEDFDWSTLGEDGSEERSGGNIAVSPMPGIVEKLNVKPGDLVKKGDPVAVVMAMKMEYTIKAERDGIVVSVGFKEGDTVGKNVPLIRFKEKSQQ